MNKAIIAFIGLGNMGNGMAANLAKAGYTVRAFDLSPQALAKAVTQGCLAAISSIDAVNNADVVISMLPSASIVQSLYLSHDALLDHISEDALVIDCSTVEPECSINLANEAKQRGLRCIDAPVSGGTAGADAGTLSFICGGNAEHVEAARPILSAMGQHIFHAGDSGAGQIAKACNNMLLAIHMAGTAEALQMGVNNGLNPKTLSEIMLSSSGCNWSLQKYNPYPGVMDKVPASNNYQGGFMLNLMIKDLGIAMATAQQSHSVTPLGEQAKQLFEKHKEANAENGCKDFSSIQAFYKP